MFGKRDTVEHNSGRPHSSFVRLISARRATRREQRQYEESV